MNRAILLFSAAVLLWLATAAPLAAFTDNGDGTVTDPATGLMWDRCSWGQSWDGANACTGPASDHDWQAALVIAVTANTDNHRGYSDWRLPNRTELESLVDITKATAPTIDTAAFPNTPSDLFWSSTVSTPNPAIAWYVSFVNGITVAFNQAFDFHVRLVRSGQSFDALAAGVATETVMITQPSSAAQSGIPFPQQPIVEVQDTNGDPVLAAGTDITAAIASGGGTLTGTTTIATDASGRATFTDLAISGTVGDRTLSFSAGSLTPATSETITLSAGLATQMGIIAGDNQSAVAGTAVATAPSVIVGDDNDNLVAGVDVTFAVESGGGSVTGAVATTNASGIATVGSWTLGDTAGTNTLTASAAGVPEVTFSASATTAPAAPTDVSATPSNAEATVTWTAPTNTGGLAITGYTVTGDPGGSCSVAGDVTECTITGLTNGTPYTFTVVATNAAGDSPASAPSSPVTPAVRYNTVGGTVSGMQLPGLVLELNGDELLLFDQDGAYSFSTELADGSPYEVTTPVVPNDHECSNATGVIAGENVTDADVTCSTDIMFADGFETLSTNPLPLD